MDNSSFKFSVAHIFSCAAVILSRRSPESRPTYKSSTSVNADTFVIAAGNRTSLGRRNFPRTRAVSSSTFAGESSLLNNSRTRARNASHSASSHASPSPSLAGARRKLSLHRCSSSIASPISVVAKIACAFRSSSATHAANSGARCRCLNISSHTSIVARVGNTLTKSVSNHCPLMMAAMISSGPSAPTCKPTLGKRSRNILINTL
mmetsp:Transcript_2324/g.9138  ORF Transcript_2324/g.9138 Transcript_2324/m.9138 type:complete len:206 (+) Transcript_2324:3028-3645(+)